MQRIVDRVLVCVDHAPRAHDGFLLDQGFTEDMAVGIDQRIIAELDAASVSLKDRVSAYDCALTDTHLRILPSVDYRTVLNSTMWQELDAAALVEPNASLDARTGEPPQMKR